MTIRKIEDLAELLCCEADEKSLSRRVYKSTDCGAWLTVTTDTLKVLRHDWIVDLRPAIIGLVVHKAIRRGSRKWVSPGDFPESLLLYLQAREHASGRWVVDEKTIRRVADIRISEKHRVLRNGRFLVKSIEETIAIPDPRPSGVRIGSIVEGVDAATDIIDLRFPFTKDDLFEALDDIEKQAHEIWMATHGCETCLAHWQEERGTDENGCPLEWGATPVWLECPNCGGQGTVI